MGEPRVSVRISGEGLRAFVRVIAGPSAGEPELRAALQRAGVVFGIDEGACESIGAQLADELFTTEEAVVAQGQLALQGADGYFVPEFAAGIQPGHVRDDGSMDFLDRELLKPVQPGTSVGRLHKATAGVPGRRVDGGELPVMKTRDCALVLGPGVSALPDGNVVATRAGVLFYLPHKSVDVVQHHVHTGKVDLRTGHLDMEGSLVVRGSVERLFHASASGDVEVQGSIDFGSVRAGGSIRVTGGVRGGDSGMLSAEGDVAVRYAEHARIVCGGLLRLESSVNSELIAHDIQVTGKLRGGKARAERSIVAREAGVPQGVSTLLSAAIPIERPVFDAKRGLEAAKDQRALVRRSARGEARGKGGKAGRAAAALASAEIERKIAIAQRRDELASQASIEVNGAVHAGVTIQIGIALLPIEQSTSFVRFTLDPQTRKVRTERFVR